MHGRTCKQYIIPGPIARLLPGPIARLRMSFDENYFTFQCEKEDKNA